MEILIVVIALALAAGAGTAVIVIASRRQKIAANDETPVGNRYAHFFTLGSICGDQALEGAGAGLEAAVEEALSRLREIGVPIGDPALLLWQKLNMVPKPGSGPTEAGQAANYADAVDRLRERVRTWGTPDELQWFQLGRLLRELPLRAATAEKQSQKHQVSVQVEALEHLASQVQLPFRLKGELTNFAQQIKDGMPGEDYESRAYVVSGHILEVF